MPARPRLRSWGFALLGAAGSVLPVAGQARLEVAPYVGLYWPTSVLGSDSGRTVKQQTSVIKGARVTLWLSGPLGIEGTIGYAPSSLFSNFLYFYGPVYPAHVLTASAKAVLRLTPQGARATLHVAGGVSLVDHGGDAYPPTDYSGPTTFYGGIASVGGVIKLARWVGLRFDAEDFVYAAHLGPCTRSGPGRGSVCDVYGENAGISTAGSTLQNDLVLSVGIVLACCPSGSPSQ